MSDPDDGGFSDVLRSISEGGGGGRAEPGGASADAAAPVSVAASNSAPPSSPEALLAAPDAGMDDAAVDALLLRLKAVEAAKRSALDAAERDYSAVSMRVAVFHQRLLAMHARHKRREEVLLSHSGQLLKSLRSEESRVKTLSTTVQRITQQRKAELGKIQEPGWAIPHHYHMTSMEHSLGHTQPHVLDVGSMIRGHLRLYAIANSTVRFQKNASHVLGKAKTARVRVSSQIKKVYKELRSERSVLHEINGIMQGLREVVGGVSVMKKLEKELREQKTEAAAEAAKAAAKAAAEAEPSPARERMPGGRAAAAVDERYNRGKLLLRSTPAEESADEEEEEEGGVGGDDDDDEKEEEAKRKKKGRRSSLGEEPLDSPNAVRVGHTPAAPPRFAARPDSPRPGGGGRLGSRNVKMRFFQALHLAPPSLNQVVASRKAERERTAATPSSPSPGPPPAGGPAPEAAAAMAGERQAAAALAEEWKMTRQMKTDMWVALEQSISQREQLRFALSERRAKAKEAADAEAASESAGAEEAEDGPAKAAAEPPAEAEQRQ